MRLGAFGALGAVACGLFFGLADGFGQFFFGGLFQNFDRGVRNEATQERYALDELGRALQQQQAK